MLQKSACGRTAAMIDQTVHHDAMRASFVTLPIIPEPMRPLAQQ